MSNNYLDYLQHSGVKGQQWGKRRYQNEDGSLTQEGYEHYGYGHGRDRQRNDYQSQQPRDTYNHRMSTINTRSAKDIMRIGNKQFGKSKVDSFSKKHGSSTFKNLVTAAALTAFIVTGAKSLMNVSTTVTTIHKEGTKGKTKWTKDTEIRKRGR